MQPRRPLNISLLYTIFDSEIYIADAFVSVRVSVRVCVCECVFVCLCVMICSVFQSPPKLC